MNKKLNYLVDVIASGMWEKYYFFIGLFLLVMLVVGIVLGVWVENTASIPTPSFLLLTAQAEKRKVKLEKKIKKAWFWFGFSLVTSVVTRLVSKVLFAYLFHDWKP